MIRRRGRTPLLLVTGLAACSPAPEPADLVLLDGRVVTVDDAVPVAEAVAVSGDRIVAVGPSDEIRALVGPDTDVVDLRGRLAVPGFIEGHAHFVSLGQARTILDLTAVTTWQELVDLVAEAARAAEPGAWIEGRGWHQERWTSVPPDTVDGVPVHASLSAVSPDNPVVLGHASGHAAYANAAALELAGVDGDTPDPPGGTIVRDAEGRATGLLRENADALVYGVVPGSGALSEEERRARLDRYVDLAGREALANGVTTFHDAGASFETIDGFRRLADEGRLPVRLYVMVRGESNPEMDERLPEYRLVGYGNDHLTVRSIKRQIDGALGSHGAWLLEPYADMPGSAGLTVEEPADIEETARIAAAHGFQLNTHAIGDRANRVVLDIYQRTFDVVGRGPDLRWRVEHAQHLHPDDVARFAELGVIAAMQGVHATSDAPWVYERLGAERAESGAYLWRSLIDAGVAVVNGTDAPVEDISPVASFYSSVARRDREGNEFFPAQRMTRMEALKSYTLDGAYAAFEEDLKGSIAVGKLADITVLDRDIMTIPEEEIPGARVVMTLVGGELRYRAGD